MYIAQELTSRIKDRAKHQNILIRDMLNDCGLSINTISQIYDKKGLSSFSLARIADYLDCSVDYLLGRTDVPEVNHGDNYRYAQIPHYAQYAASTGRELGKSQSPDDVDEITILQEYEKNKQTP